MRENDKEQATRSAVTGDATADTTATGDAVTGDERKQKRRPFGEGYIRQSKDLLNNSIIRTCDTDG